MATNTTTPTTALKFISVNPATAAFREGEAAAQARYANDLAIERGIVANTEQIAQAPSRLRTISAQADTADANAQVAKQTVEPRVSQAQSAATQAEVGARYAEPRAAAGLRQQNAAALNAEMAGFYKSLELMNAGRVDEAQAVANATGQPLPPEVMQNAQLRATVTAIAKRAQELYPNRPAFQQTFIEAQMRALKQRRESGEAIDAILQPYIMPQGAPPPPAESTRPSYEIVHRQETDPNTGQVVIRSYSFDKTSNTLTPIEGTGAFNKATGAGSGSGGRMSVFQQKQQAWLAVHPGDTQGALDYASGRRQLSEPEIAKAAISMAGTEIRNNQMLRFRNVAEQQAAIKKRAAEIAAQIRSGFGQQAPPTMQPGAPATAVPPAPRDPAQRVVGQVYQAPDGRYVKWLGNGWQVVQ